MSKSRIIRWTASRKREVVASILNQERTRAAVMAEYPDLTEEELTGWIEAYKRGRGDASHMRQSAMIDARRPKETV